MMLEQLILNLVIAFLKREGYLDAADAFLARGAVDIVEGIKNAQITYTYPTGKNGAEGPQ